MEGQKETGVPHNNRETQDRSDASFNEEAFTSRKEEDKTYDKKIVELKNQILEDIGAVPENKEQAGIVPIYHHTDKEFEDFATYEKGVWFTENPNEVVGAGIKGPISMTRYVDLSQLKLAGFKEEAEMAGMSTDQKIKYLKKKGFDGLARRGYSGVGEMHYWLLNPDKVFQKPEDVKQAEASSSDSKPQKENFFSRIFKRK